MKRICINLQRKKRRRKLENPKEERGTQKQKGTKWKIPKKKGGRKQRQK
jgi:hypothetical protein